LFSKKLVLIFVLILVTAGGYYSYQQSKKENYAGMSIIPERTDDVPLYKGLKPDGSPAYLIEGDHLKEILAYYEKVLPNYGWTAEYIHSTQDIQQDDSGFMSIWRKPGQTWELSIDGDYFKNENQTAVVFDKMDILTFSKWIDEIPEEICINEQPDRSDDCFKMTDKHSIRQIVELVNGAPDWQKDKTPYKGISTIDFGNINVEVHYDLEKGIYFISEKGTKWMKPEKEFFELTKISKEY
jgi:hypothetical protein